ncbi:MAG: SgcJ/EcaC family oxidoreductase [Gammaproteobacteria bacterium]|nr:SgcJ/EcaC family oxidoreductase [Gammaproteobacteria bacterium]MDH5302736.1 SgcJ/EcaC family oxidoreductase [Gammaproteobacteria bacterium]MDH5321332.1 SgcJ/EcaC family oxidoreductase [Gammaproteobacteria bacterium]
MKNIALATMAVGAALVASHTASAENVHTSAIQNLLSAYETALNAQDTDTIVGLYADDGVFMPQHSLPQVGIHDIRAAYDNVFTAITLDIEFAIDEIGLLSDDWAFARTRSEGTVRINATGDSGPEANQELFLFQRTDGNTWQIARYIFSTTNPPRG